MIRKRLLLGLFLCVYAFAKAQVGIGTTDPKATLDIPALSTTTPDATTGILIPRVDEFPTGVTIDQDGMMVFLTGNGTPAKGFYYWNHTSTNWTLISGVTAEGGSLDDAYDFGGAGAGNMITATDGAVTINGEDGVLVTGTFGSGETITASGNGARLFFNPRKAAFRAGNTVGTLWDDSNVGDYSTALGQATMASGNYSFSMGQSNQATGAYSVSFGRQSEASASFSTTFGFGNEATANSAFAFGANTFATGALSTSFGSVSIASGELSTAFGRNNTAPSYAETTIGHYSTNYSPNNSTAIDLNDRLFSIGNGTTNIIRGNALTIFKSGLMNINDEYNMPLIDGTINQVMTTDGAGNVTFENIPTFTDTDNQQVDVLNLDGTDLEISLQDDGVVTQTLDLSSIDTDNQQIDVLNLDGTNLEISLQDDGVVTQTLDLSSIDTDNQQIDVLNLDGTNLEISLQDDGVATQTLDLSPIDTDNQQIDVLNLDGTNLEISLQDDGVVTQTLDLSSLRILSINDLTDGKTDTANSSVFLGAGAGNNDNDGLNFNTGIGANALISNTSGFQNTALGNSALLLNTTGSNNVALGQVALIDNTTGSENIAIGRNAVANNVDGDQNIGIGGQALFNNISTNDNIAVGNQSLFSSTTGRNIGIGTSAGTNITTGTRNIGIGFRAQSSHTQGNDNITIGESVMNSINSTTNASNNVALGNDAMSNLSEGSNNVAIGTSALFGNGNGTPNFANNNVAIGYQAGLNTEGDNNIFIGYQAGLLNPFSNNRLFIENSNGDENDALIYGEFDTNILRTNGELQIGNPTTTGYSFPTTDGTNGQILITDGAGNVTFQNAGASGGTLDQAYDFGGAGVGRTINVDNGAVVIQGNASGVSATTSAQLILTETGANDFSRLRFTNSVETDNTWTIASRTDNTDASSIMNINHTNAGDIIQVFGDGVVEMNGQIGINLNNPDRALTLPNNTDILIGRAIANSWDIYSDSRVKTNQQPLENGLQVLLEIIPKTYFHHDSNFTNGILQLEEKGLQTVGFIAQELYEVLPEAVQKPENENTELWSVDYDKVVPITVQAIQELKKEIDTLKLENQQLKTQLSKYNLLEARILALENKKEESVIILK